MQRGFIITLILAIVVILFAINNSQVVPVDFIFTEILLSQAIVIFACVLIGAIIASTFGIIRQVSLKKNIHKLESEIKSLEKELAKLKVELIDKEKTDYIDRDEFSKSNDSEITFLD